MIWSHCAQLAGGHNFAYIYNLASQPVDKDRFLVLVNNFTSLTAEEAHELIALQDQFPYSQVIHHLCSRAAQDQSLANREELLHTSAIYATERSVLKFIMTAPVVPRTDEQVAEDPEEDLPEIVSPVPSAIAERAISDDVLRRDLLQDMDILKQMKTKYEATVEQLDRIKPSQQAEESKKKMKKSVDPQEPIDTLIEEIKSSKKKVKPEGPKQKEQIEIIENFIKTQPTISKNKLASAPADQSDLAEKSLLYGDHIVSETLVEILLKQGKKDKAIEVLKKLIWKIPQKKAYFAAQIEELKK